MKRLPCHECGLTGTHTQDCDRVPETMPGEIDYSGLPTSKAAVVDAVRNYVERGRAPGDFLRAVILNDLAAAVRSAEPADYLRLRDWVRWWDTMVPTDCVGSVERYTKWQSTGGLVGRLSGTLRVRG